MIPSLVLLFAACIAQAGALPTDPASPVSPRRFGVADHRVETIRGWYLWQKWDPDTWEAEVTKETGGELYHVRVLPWATTYRRLVYGGRPDDLLPGERVNLFFAADERHPRGYVVHFQDELCQMKGHGHVWEVRTAEGDRFTARVLAGGKPLDEAERSFRLEPTCKVWRDGKPAERAAPRPRERIYLTWRQRGDERLVALIADDASLDAVKKEQQIHVAAGIAKEGIAGQIERVQGKTVHFMAFATAWQQAGQMKPGQPVRLVRTEKGYRAMGLTIAARLVSQTNRGSYGSGVNDMVLELADDAPAALAWAKHPVVRLIPESAVDLGQVTEKHVMIPMRDGVALSTYLYLPPGKGPWPVIYEQRYADLRGAETRKGYARLAAAGFVVAAQSFRGAQLSEGTWVGYRALGWGEKKDGFDSVEWLANQPWSTGKIGSVGSSQGGFAQNFLAVAGPPHLVCQYMIDTGLSLFHEGYRIGGTARPERFKGMDAVCRNPQDNRRLLGDWFAHPTYDAYWAEENCALHFDKMNVPCFTVGSWFDFMSVGSIDSYVGRQHRGGPDSRGRQQLILGPWLHGRFKETNKAGDLVFPENAKFAMEAHMIRWFSHHLKGEANGVERDDAVRYYTMGAVDEKDAPGNVWHTAKDWPIPSHAAPLYLHAGGRLNEEISVAEPPTVFSADPIHPDRIPGPGFPGAKDARDFEKQAQVRTFTSDVLKEPVEWTGKVQAELYVSSSARDTDFIVRISDVYPDGRSILLMDYVRRARYREGYDKEVMMTPGEVYKVAFDIGWTSQIFNRGHRIRVTIASTGAPFYEPNPNTGEPLGLELGRTVIAENMLYHRRAHASHIVAPVRR